MNVNNHNKFMDILKYIHNTDYNRYIFLYIYTNNFKYQSSK